MGSIVFLCHVLTIYRFITVCETINAFILGGETEMVSSQLLRARERCVVDCFSIRTVGHFQYGIRGDKSFKFQLTIAYSLLHLTR